MNKKPNKINIFGTDPTSGEPVEGASLPPPKKRKKKPPRKKKPAAPKEAAKAKPETKPPIATEEVDSATPSIADEGIQEDVSHLKDETSTVSEPPSPAEVLENAGSLVRTAWTYVSRLPRRCWNFFVLVVIACYKKVRGFIGIRWWELRNWGDLCWENRLPLPLTLLAAAAVVVGVGYMFRPGPRTPGITAQHNLDRFVKKQTEVNAFEIFVDRIFVEQSVAASPFMLWPTPDDVDFEARIRRFDQVLYNGLPSEQFWKARYYLMLRKRDVAEDPPYLTHSQVLLCIESAERTLGILKGELFQRDVFVSNEEPSSVSWAYLAHVRVHLDSLITDLRIIHRSLDKENLELLGKHGEELNIFDTEENRQQVSEPVRKKIKMLDALYLDLTFMESDLADAKRASIEQGDMGELIKRSLKHIETLEGNFPKGQQKEVAEAKAAVSLLAGLKSDLDKLKWHALAKDHRLLRSYAKGLENPKKKIAVGKQRRTRRQLDELKRDLQRIERWRRQEANKVGDVRRSVTLLVENHRADREAHKEYLRERKKESQESVERVMVRLNKLFASVESALSVAEQYDTNATKEQLRALDSAIDASLIALSDLKELVPGEPKPRPDSGETKLEDYAIQIKAELKKNTSPDFDVKKLKRYLIDSKQIVAEDCKGYIERLNWAEVMLTEKLTPDLLSSPILKALVDPNATSESNATEKVDSSKQSSLASHPWITHEGLEQVLHQKEKASDTANQTSVPDARKKSGLANNPWIKAGQDPQNTEGPAINQKARDEFVAKRLKKQKSVDEFVAKRLKKFESYSEEDRQREEMIRWKVLRRCFTNVERQIAKHNDIPSLESLRPLPSYLSGMEMNLRQLEALTGADFRKEISRVNSIGHDIHAAYETNQAVFALTLLTEDLANIKEKVAGIAKAREAAGNGLLQNPFLKDMQQEAEKK